VVEVEEDAPVGVKRKLRAVVWNDFDLIKVNGVYKARCKWCKKHLGGETRNGTTHLKNHFAICEDRACRKGLTQSTLKLSTNSKDSTVTLEKYVFDQDVARKELALMMSMSILCPWWTMLDLRSSVLHCSHHSSWFLETQLGRISLICISA
jgi:hypothetical protein